jgi:hypothetical protein
MPAAVISIGASPQYQRTGRGSSGHWWLLEVATPGGDAVPDGILLVDSETDQLSLRCRDTAELDELCGLEEQQTDILDFLEADLRQKADETGGSALLDSLEQSLSHFLRISDRAAIAYTGSPQRAADRLFDDYVDSEVRPFETHLPLYGLRAAATKFGEGMATGEAAGDEEAWIRVRTRSRLSASMFVARVVGRSMEPLIPDDSLCVFRTGVTGTRQGKYLLIEKFGESDFASRYTVKRYTSEKTRSAEEDRWEHAGVRLEPLNREFEAFHLSPDQFRVIAEFVEVLGPASE